MTYNEFSDYRYQVKVTVPAGKVNDTIMEELELMVSRKHGDCFISGSRKNILTYEDMGATDFYGVAVAQNWAKVLKEHIKDINTMHSIEVGVNFYCFDCEYNAKGDDRYCPKCGEELEPLRSLRWWRFPIRATKRDAFEFSSDNKLE